MSRYSPRHRVQASALEALAPALVASALVEFLLIRTFSRMGVILPKTETVLQIYNATIFLGSIVFNLASLLALLVLGLAFYGLLRAGGGFNLALSFLLLEILQLNLLLLFTSPTPALSLVYNLSLGAGILMLCWRGFKAVEQSTGRIVFLLFATSYLASIYHNTVPLVNQVLSSPVAGLNPTLAFNLGEVLAVTNTVFLFASLISAGGSFMVRKKWLVISTVVASLFSMAYLGSPWITSILTTWTLGFTLYLPFPVYAASLWLFTYSVLQARSVEGGRGLAAGLILILLGGRMLQLTYFNTLAMAGLYLVSQNLANQASLRAGREPGHTNLTQ